MKATYNEATREITITLPAGESRPSNRGRSAIVASSHGNQSAGFDIDGHPAYVNVNVLYFPDEVSTTTKMERAEEAAEAPTGPRRRAA